MLVHMKKANEPTNLFQTITLLGECSATELWWALKGGSLSRKCSLEKHKYAPQRIQNLIKGTIESVNSARVWNGGVLRKNRWNNNFPQNLLTTWLFQTLSSAQDWRTLHIDNFDSLKIHTVYI